MFHDTGACPHFVPEVSPESWICTITTSPQEQAPCPEHTQHNTLLNCTNVWEMSDVNWIKGKLKTLNATIKRSWKFNSLNCSVVNLRKKKKKERNGDCVVCYVVAEGCCNENQNSMINPKQRHVRMEMKKFTLTVLTRLPIRAGVVNPSPSSTTK